MKESELLPDESAKESGVSAGAKIYSRVRLVNMGLVGVVFVCSVNTA